MPTENSGTMPAERGAHRSTIVVFGRTTPTKTKMERHQNVPALQKEVKSEHENTPGKLYYGIKLSLFLPGPPNIINLLIIDDTESENDQFNWQNMRP